MPLGSKRSGFDSQHGLLFRYTFFYLFYQFSIGSWDVQLHTKFQPQWEKFSVFWFWKKKNRFKISSAKCHTKFEFLSQVSHKQWHSHSLMQILIGAAQYFKNCGNLSWKSFHPIVNKLNNCQVNLHLTLDIDDQLCVLYSFHVKIKWFWVIY